MERTGDASTVTLPQPRRAEVTIDTDPSRRLIAYVTVVAQQHWRPDADTSSEGRVGSEACRKAWHGRDLPLLGRPGDRASATAAAHDVESRGQATLAIAPSSRGL
ncbi:hypothetical protein H7H73_32670 [Mycobacterium rufum]|uniref:Uncharacterized protein n=1 Tax=Mycolicibacterium rufum TaxID=318424 RepID=A0A9X2YI04_9MYCO|nr:hypothetical protein [Mycolicibacterium rufum]